MSFNSYIKLKNIKRLNSLVTINSVRNINIKVYNHINLRSDVIYFNVFIVKYMTNDNNKPHISNYKYSRNV